MITSLSHAGEGVGRHDGRAVFVPFALPGETVRVELVEEKPTFARARLLEVLTPVPERCAPPCPHHFTVQNSAACGGCQLQHLTYAAQLAFKQQVVSEQFKRIGGFTDPPVRATLPAPDPFHYRNYVQFSLTPEGRLGFRSAHARAILPIETCHLLHPTLAALLPQLAIESALEVERLSLRVGAEDEPLIIFESAADAPDLELDLPVSAALLRPTGESFPLIGVDYVVEQVRGRAFKVSAGSFFQTHTAQAETLVTLVLEALALHGAEIVLDLYCGVGLFSAFIAPHVKKVIGVETFAPAVNDAAENLDEFENIEIYQAPAEEVLPTLSEKFEAVVLDPPRAGCARPVVDALIASNAQRLVYVSCDPATLARDAKLLVEGGYVLQSLQPVDMFPQTRHVECVGVFSKP